MNVYTSILLLDKGIIIILYAYLFVAIRLIEIFQTIAYTNVAHGAFTSINCCIIIIEIIIFVQQYTFQRVLRIRPLTRWFFDRCLNAIFLYILILLRFLKYCLFLLCIRNNCLYGAFLHFLSFRICLR